jgi:hypothetical protein
MTIMPRSRSSSDGLTHLASGTCGLPVLFVVEADEEEKAVFRWVRVV